MNILIITSKATSANLRVAIDFAQALNSHSKIFVICTGESSAHYSFNRVDYIQVVDPRQSLIKKFLNYKKKGTFWSKLPYRLYTYNYIPLIDAIKKSPIEKLFEKEAKNIIQSHKIDFILSTNNPYFGHRTALSLKKISNSPILEIWLDPFNLRKSFFAKCLEKRYIKKSDYIFSLPEVILADKLINKEKNKVILFELPYIVERIVKPSNFDIIFAGSFSSVRNPLPVLSFILKCLPFINNKYHFYFYCNKRDSLLNFEQSSNGQIKICPYLSPERLNERLSNCYMLLNIGNNNNNLQLPSKVVDYISYRKPIISFQQSDHDPSNKYLYFYPDVLTININNTIKSNYSSFINFINSHHYEISFSKLMDIPLYKESTPSFLSNKLKSVIK